jgi:hypothetical protein
VPVATSDAPLPGPTDDQAAAAARTADARLARVHLRGGLLSLARATLEGMAGAGTLDRDAMADLAEVRWRSGDLEGAADAARAHQATGGDEPLAALILAEDMARAGQEDDANPIAGSLYERVGGAMDVLFANEPRSAIWPPADEGWMATGAAEPGHWGLLVGGSEVAAPSATSWELDIIEQPAAEPAPDFAPAGRGAVGHPEGATSTTGVVMSGLLAGEELETVDRAIARGDIAAAVARLAVLPAGSRQLSAIHLVRGDAYRSLGRDNEAAAAYQAAHQALAEGPAPKEPT